MNSRALLLLVLGLLLGPGYFAFCEHLSGKAGQTYALTERGDRWPLPDGSILRLRGGKAWKPVALELKPDDNGYRLRFTFNVTGSADAANEYQLNLLQGDATIMQRSLHIKGHGAVDATPEPFQVFYPGSYLLVLEEVGTPALDVAGVSLQVDTGVEKPRMWIAWSGLALLVVAVALLLRDAITHARKRR